MLKVLLAHLLLVSLAFSQTAPAPSPDPSAAASSAVPTETPDSGSLETPADATNPTTTTAADLMEMVEKQDADSTPEQKFELLERFVPLDYPEPGEFPSPGEEELARMAQSLMVSIPGHAEYLLKNLQARKAAAETNPDQRDVHGVTAAKAYTLYCRTAFRSLARLRSSETIQVLAGLLEKNDQMEVKKPGKPPQMESWSVAAARALTLLDIEDPPVTTEPMEVAELDVQAWKKWIAEVKSGGHMYRFRGIPQQFTFEGPFVIGSAATGDSTGFPKILIIIPLVLFVCGGIATLKGRRNRQWQPPRPPGMGPGPGPGPGAGPGMPRR